MTNNFCGLLIILILSLFILIIVIFIILGYKWAIHIFVAIFCIFLIGSSICICAHLCLNENRVIIIDDFNVSHVSSFNTIYVNNSEIDDPSIEANVSITQELAYNNINIPIAQQASICTIIHSRINEI